jgi:exportin-1
VKTPKVRGLRTIKKDILKLLDTYVERATDLVTVNNNMVDSFFDVVLCDYNSNVDIARDPEVLDAIVTIVNRLGVSLFVMIPKVCHHNFFILTTIYL